MKDHSPMSCCDQRFIHSLDSIDTRLFEKVACHMFTNHLVVGDICIQRSNEIVAIEPAIFNAGITLGAVRVGIANPIHPMTRPPLTEMRTVKQVLYQGIIAMRPTQFRHPMI